MTYCVALRLKDGLVMLSDTRTNAGVDNVDLPAVDTCTAVIDHVLAGRGTSRPGQASVWMVCGSPTTPTTPGPTHEAATRQTRSIGHPRYSGASDAPLIACSSREVGRRVTEIGVLLLLG